VKKDKINAFLLRGRGILSQKYEIPKGLWEGEAKNAI
jgi:hypothetical protein